MPLVGFSTLMGSAHPVGRQDGHFYFRLFLWSRKASSAITNIPTLTIRDATVRIIETISYAVISTTSYVFLANQGRSGGIPLLS